MALNAWNCQQYFWMLMAPQIRSVYFTTGDTGNDKITTDGISVPEPQNGERKCFGKTTDFTINN